MICKGEGVLKLCTTFVLNYINRAHHFPCISKKMTSPFLQITSSDLYLYTQLKWYLLSKYSLTVTYSLLIFPLLCIPKYWFLLCEVLHWNYLFTCIFDGKALMEKLFFPLACLILIILFTFFFSKEEKLTKVIPLKGVLF